MPKIKNSYSSEQKARMDMRTVVRHIIGYIIGITVFFMCFPAIIYMIAHYANPYVEIHIIGNEYVRLGIVILFFTVGILFAVWSNIALLVIGKGGPTDAFGVSISPRTQHLVVKGPYKYTRNPMVFGALMCYLAVALYLDSLVSIIVILACIPILILYLKKTEEKRLERDFGTEWLEYKKKVSMLIPLPPRT